MHGIWDAVQQVTGWFSLIAFLAAAALLYGRHRISQLTEQMKHIPSEQRAAGLDAILNRFNVDTKDLTEKQRFRLAELQIRNAQRRYQYGLALTAVLAVLLSGLWASSMLIGGQEAPYEPPRLTPQEQDSLEYLRSMAGWLRSNGRPRQALAYYDEALKFDSVNPSILKAVAEVQAQIGGTK